MFWVILKVEKRWNDLAWCHFFTSQEPAILTGVCRGVFLYPMHITFGGYMCMCCNRTKYMPRTSSRPCIQGLRMNPVMMSSLPLGPQPEVLQVRPSVRLFLYLVCITQLDYLWHLYSNTRSSINHFFSVKWTGTISLLALVMRVRWGDWYQSRSCTVNVSVPLVAE